MKKIFLLLVPSIFVASVSMNSSKEINSSIWHQEFRLNWNEINLNDAPFWNSLHFPKNFSWGCATSAIQIEGMQTHSGKFVKNNWTEDPTFSQEFSNNLGSDHWNRFKEDVQLIKKAGFNTYRLSIPWEKIEPCMGVYDEQAMDHYKELIKELKKNDIEPWVCLHHFTLPVWFATLGGFEKEENLIHFTKFCNYVFDNLNKNVNFWATYNEPVAYVLEAYFLGSFPPHSKNLTLAGIVMNNMLKAHVTIYENFKEKNNTTQVGLIKMFHPLDSYSDWNPLETVACQMGNFLVHDTVLNYFKTGDFNWLYLVRDTNKKAKKALDFIGVNYYAHEIIQCGPTKFRTIKIRKGETKVPDKNQGIYPEGLYRAIVKAAQLNVPLYITENGIADSTDQLRNHFIKQHLFVLQKALNDGYDIRGYHYWTLLDSRGWKSNYQSKYGLYAVNPTTNHRTLREGAQSFINFVRKQTGIRI